MIFSCEMETKLVNTTATMVGGRAGENKKNRLCFSTCAVLRPLSHPSYIPQLSTTGCYTVAVEAAGLTKRPQSRAAAQSRLFRIGGKKKNHPPGFQ